MLFSPQIGMIVSSVPLYVGRNQNPRTNNITASKITDGDVSAMREYAQKWQRISPNSSILLEPNNGAAIDLATKIGYQNHAMECLVTGSLFLVGSALRHLDPTGEKV
jgi:folylpolyglutamate synthase